MPEADRNGKSFHARVKGEFVGKPVPPDRNQTSLEKETEPDGNQTSLEKETESDGSERNPTESDVNQKQGHICKYVPMRLLRLYL